MLNEVKKKTMQKYWIIVLLLSILILYFQYNIFRNEVDKISCGNNDNDNDNNEVENLLINLSKRSNKLPVRVKKIVIGYNTNLDLVCNALALFNHFNISLPQNYQNSEKISNFQELASTFADYFRRGSAAERYYDNQQVFFFYVSLIYFIYSFF